MSSYSKILILLPHQLFELSYDFFDQETLVVLYEHPHYFRRFNFHKQKLILHRASMKAYEDLLNKKKLKNIYLTFDSNLKKELKKILNEYEINCISFVDPVDDVIEGEFNTLACDLDVRSIFYESPSFLTTIDELDEFFSEKDTYTMHPFYVKQRKRLKILLTKQGKPLGGKWSFDADNREAISQDVKKFPLLKSYKSNKYVKEAIIYVDKHFKDNYGATDKFIYPVTHSQAKDALGLFFNERFKFFGKYQDAIIPGESFLYHSVISSSLNNGLLTPDYVVEEAMKYALSYENIPIASLEGFIRQIIGWREYVRGVYLYAGAREVTSNYFAANKKMSQSCYDGTTGIEPVDDVINRVNQYAYAHHIERLMILSNFFTLTGAKPDDVYQWFSELFIDAYDWVMIPNVYGMGLYADGGLMSTKPYISSSNYILKMSSYKKGGWAEVWADLYWNFLHQNKKLLAKNYRCKLMMTSLAKKSVSQMTEHIKSAQTFIKEL